MSKRLVHTPEGVRDIYGEELEKKLVMQDKLHQTFLGAGYRDIQTPSFEFFDVFSKDIGTTPSRELYKFFETEKADIVLKIKGAKKFDDALRSELCDALCEFVERY